MGNRVKKIKMPAFLARRLAKPQVRIALWTGLFFVLTLAVLAAHFVPEGNLWEEGKVAPRDVQANRSLTLVDNVKTEEKQQEALRGFQDSYTIDLERYNNQTLVEISNYFSTIQGIVFEGAAEDADPEQTLTQKAIDLRRALPFILSDEEWLEVASLSRDALNRLHDQAVVIASNTMSEGVLQENLNTAKGMILEEVRATRGISGIQEDLLLEILSTVTYFPTYVYDQAATEARKAEILSGVSPVYKIVQKDQLVVGKGEIITAEQMDILNRLGYTSETNPTLVIGGLAVLLGLLMVVVRGYLKMFAPQVYRNEKMLVLLMTIVLLSFVFFEMILAIELSPVAEQAAQVGYLLPVAMSTMLIATLLDARLAVLLDLIMAIFAGLYTGQVGFGAVAALGGIVGVMGVNDLSQRSDLSWTALRIAGVNTAAILAIGMLNGTSPEVLLMAVGFGIGNGLLSSVLTLGILPFCESLFGITTSIRLLELANPNQPLLKKLLMDAPGTYHHCVMVGNMGEAAAEAIGANGLVVRVGAYYHDIGKTKRPYFFSENQFSDENPHDKISPTLSTLILTSHVKDGIEMAHEAKLPPVITDMIAQHHGNSLVGFFYHKAKENGEEIREEDFRYDQPKPQTKEAAILMMADTVEAAVRSKKNATPGQIEGFIRMLIKGKLNDGQFDECDLTFKDLDKVAAAFVRVVNGIYHKRVEYPDQNAMLKQKQEKKGKRGNNHAGNNQ